MRIRWFGQSTFLISGERMVFIDPFGAMDGLAERGCGSTTHRLKEWRPICCCDDTASTTTRSPGHRRPRR